MFVENLWGKRRNSFILDIVTNVESTYSEVFECGQSLTSDYLKVRKVDRL